MSKSKESKIKILEYMIENIKSDRPLLQGVYYSAELNHFVPEDDIQGCFDLNKYDYTIMTDTTYLNGRQIHKPITLDELAHYSKQDKVYIPAPNDHFRYEITVREAINDGYTYVYFKPEYATEVGYILYGEK